MADNVTIPATGSGTATPVIATDDVSSVHFQKVKIDVGADGVSAALGNANPLPVSDAGGSLTVDGTVAVTNAGLTELAAAIDTEVQVDVVGALPAGTNNIGDVDILSIAAGNNNIGDVDIASIAAGDNNIGNVDIASIAAGDNNIGNVDLASAIPAGTNNIGDVDVLSIIPGTGATNLGKAEDAAHTSGDTGVMMLAVRQDSHSDLGADGDYIPPTIDADGGLRVSIVAGSSAGTQYTEGDTDATISGPAIMWEDSSDTLRAVSANKPLPVQILDAVTLGTSTSITSVVPGTAATNLGKAEDAAHSSGDVGVMMLAVRQDSHSDLGADGDYMPPTIDADGGLRVSIVAGAGSGGTSAADDADFTDGTTAGTPAMGVYESTPSTVTDGDLGVVGITEARRLKTSATIDAALPAGANAIGKLAANSGVDIGDVDITSIAAGDNNIGNVDIVSLPALAAGTNAVGKLLPPDTDVTAHTNYAKKYYTNAGAVTDGIIWSPAAGKRWHVVSMYINVSAACTLTLEDDKAGGDEAVWKGEYAANSGVTIHFGEMYPLASGEDAADLLVTTTAGNVYITVTGFEI